MQHHTGQSKLGVWNCHGLELWSLVIFWWEEMWVSRSFFVVEFKMSPQYAENLFRLYSPYKKKLNKNQRSVFAKCCRWSLEIQPIEAITVNQTPFTTKTNQFIFHGIIRYDCEEGIQNIISHMERSYLVLANNEKTVGQSRFRRPDSARCCPRRSNLEKYYSISLIWLPRNTLIQ